MHTALRRTLRGIRALCLGLLALIVAGASELGAGALPDPFPAPTLQMRTNLVDGFNVPAGASANSATPAIATGGQVAVKLVIAPGEPGQGVWAGPGDGTGAIVHGAPVDAVISDVTINPSGAIVFAQIFSAANGLYRYDPLTGVTAILTTQPLGASSWSSPQLDARGVVGYRASFPGNNLWLSVDDGTTAIHAVEVGLDPMSPFSFLFTPRLVPRAAGARGGAGAAVEIVGKARYGAAGMVGESQPDRIVRVDDAGIVTVLAEDQDADPLAPFTRFDNGVAAASDGRIAFVAQRPDGARAVVRLDPDAPGVFVTIADDQQMPVGAIDFFTPAVSAQGQVAFRGVDDQGLDALFIGDGTTLVRVIGEHDLIETDLGTARLDQNVPGDPIFGGGVALSDDGTIAFKAALTPPDNDQIEWGTGLFTVNGSVIFADDFESGTLDAWLPINP
ncbi:MAG: hypothetical protein AAF772_00195 [Acidobacteriota bacterium]